MKRCYSFMVFVGFHFLLFGQNPASDSTFVDNMYREDQFYVSVTYNLLGSKPQGVSQNGFSGGFHVGFIRDMPLNKNRNFALGLGFGISTNSYNQNMLISKDENKAIVFSVLDKKATDFSKNKFTTYLLEIPLEVRWRTSTAVDYNFWRIYSGFKFSYLLYNSSKFKSNEGDVKLSNIDDFNRFQYGIMMSAGYSNINIHFYYSLNDIFKNRATIDGKRISMNAIKIGLIYYIL
ncbi:MAG TPA: porin family protein [Flavobacteriaceae bacterium]|nr:porin family protein [Flavobacteriaceae bacterium]